jgi:hypothetical protein
LIKNVEINITIAAKNLYPGVEGLYRKIEVVKIDRTRIIMYIDGHIQEFNYGDESTIKHCIEGKNALVCLWRIADMI